MSGSLWDGVPVDKMQPPWGTPGVDDGVKVPLSVLLFRTDLLIVVMGQ